MINQELFQIKTNPQAAESNIIQGEHWRITMLTESLVRLEWSESGFFENHPTQVVFNRNFGKEVNYQVTNQNGRIRIRTPFLSLDYDGKPFSKEGLRIVVAGVPGSQFNTWHYGDTSRGALHGTARTLDEANGAIPLGDGVLSRDGWAVLDDSTSNVLLSQADLEGGQNENSLSQEARDGIQQFGTWVVPRDHNETDIYFFGYGLRFIEAVRDLYRLTGPTPLLPRYALGNWWSRFYRYSHSTYLALMDNFRKEKLPFTTAVIDIDWHKVGDIDPKYGSGWTGYTWDEEVFPDPKAFLGELHNRGLHTAVNLHPRDGVRAFEKPYRKFAEHMGIDPATEEPVEFDITDPRFVEGYFDMHHDLDRDGIDFWWVDWQQGGVTRVAGLDPLWVLNHFHYLDSAHDGRWPMTFSRFAGPGSHRYPIGFSGDTVMSWKSLDFQPYFTATASNIGYGWWSHDIGGHMLGVRDDELEARWYQFGAFSPINRLHSSSSRFSGKEPWRYPSETREAMEFALRLRHALLPYLYTMNYRASEQGRPLVEPMYWQSPEVMESYSVANEYRFGSELIVAPITEPRDSQSQMASTDVWLPQGGWFDFFTGRYYNATRSEQGRRLQVSRELDAIPVFARAGGIVPLQQSVDGEELNYCGNPHALQILAFAGADGEFELVEDNSEYTNRHVVRTAMKLQWRDEQGNTSFAVAGLNGQEAFEALVPELRSWTVTLRGVERCDAEAVQVLVSRETGENSTLNMTSSAEIIYDEETLSLNVTVADVPITSDVTVTVLGGLQIARNPYGKDAERVLMRANINNLTKDKVMWMIDELGTSAIPSLFALETPTLHSAEGASKSVALGQGDNPEYAANRDALPDNFYASHMPRTVISALSEVLLRSE